MTTRNPTLDWPRAPSQDVWNHMTPFEQQQVVDSLPCTAPELEALPPEGDPHKRPIDAARDALESWFRAQGRGIYVGSDLLVYYPDEPRFAPDVFVVMDVDPHDRLSWIVSDEQRGLDWILEVLYSGDRRKDLVVNCERYARLGVPEYFVYDRKYQALYGWRLNPKSSVYERILPQEGRLDAHSIGLSLAIEGDRLRFYSNMAPVPQSREMLAKLGKRVDEIEARAERLRVALAEAKLRAEKEQRRREEEERRREEEERQRKAAEKRVAELEAMLKVQEE